VAGDGGGQRRACGRDPPKKIKIKKDPGACCLSLAACGFIWRPRNLAA